MKCSFQCIAVFCHGLSTLDTATARLQVPVGMSRPMPGPLFTHWTAPHLATTNPKRLFAGYWVGRRWDFSSLPISCTDHCCLQRKASGTNTRTYTQFLPQGPCSKRAASHGRTHLISCCSFHCSMMCLQGRSQMRTQIHRRGGSERRRVAASTYSSETEPQGCYSLPTGCS